MTREELEIKVQEIDVELDKLDLDLQTVNDDEFDELNSKFKALKKEQKEYIKQLKAIDKENSKMNQTFIDKLKIWHVLYGIAIVALCFPLISRIASLRFASWLIGLFQGAIANLNPATNKVLYYIVLSIFAYSLPIILFIVTWEIYLNLIKTKFDKKVFLIIWALQTIESIITIILIGVAIY